MSLFIVVFAVSWVLLVIQADSSYKDRCLTRRQMRRRGFIDTPVLPFVAHGGMWGDTFLITPLISYIGSEYWTQWSGEAWLIALTVGTLASWGIHREYARDGIRVPSCHAYHGQLTFAGAVHLWYMAAALTLLMLFFFATRASVGVAVTAFGVLLAHLLFQTFQIPRYLKRSVWTRSNIFEAVGGAGALSLGLVWVLLHNN